VGAQTYKERVIMKTVAYKIAMDLRLSDEYLKEKSKTFVEAKEALKIREEQHIHGMTMMEQIAYFLDNPK
jgi:hypothetical protein